MQESEILRLIDKALEARLNAYTPYSKFKVGAVVIDEKNREFTGANVENGSFGLTNCAERSAIFTAISNGSKQLKTVVVVANTTGPVSPCGACRQVISEFATDDIVIILSNLEKEYKIMSIDEILPYRFKL